MNQGFINPFSVVILMNYYAVLTTHYDGKIWGIAEDYSILDWGD
jgi:hypothetical protein